jgi:hypothetical protein
MILNWNKHLKFPDSPRVSPEANDLLQRLLCDPEDRLGSKEPDLQPMSLVGLAMTMNQAKMSAFVNSGGFPTYGHRDRSVDGANLIKVKTLDHLINAL